MGKLGTQDGIYWGPLHSLSGDGAGPELRADGMVQLVNSPKEDSV